jgi:hypothetical protein
MPDIAMLLADVARLRLELDSCKAQQAKLKAKGAKDKAREAGKAIEESQAFYDAAVDRLPPEIAADMGAHVEALVKAHAAVDKVTDRLRGLTPAVPDITVASAGGAAHDATVSVKES